MVTSPTGSRAVVRTEIDTKTTAADSSELAAVVVVAPAWMQRRVGKQRS